MLKKLDTIKMFFTAVDIVPFEVDRNSQVESRSALSPFYSMLSPILSSVQSGRLSRLITSILADFHENQTEKTGPVRG